MMNKFRQDLVVRMIRVYGFEHEIVIQFAALCEKCSNTDYNDTILKIMVEANEECPWPL